MCDSQPMWLHGMPATKVEVANIMVVEVGNLYFVGVVDDSGACVHHAYFVILVVFEPARVLC